jgi:hypothetical protein
VCTRIKPLVLFTGTHLRDRCGGCVGKIAVFLCREFPTLLHTLHCVLIQSVAIGVKSLTECGEQGALWKEGSPLLLGTCVGDGGGGN